MEPTLVFALGKSAFTLIGFQSDKQGSTLNVDPAGAFALALQRLVSVNR